MPELPIACTLTPVQMREQQRELLPALVAQAKDRRELADGYMLCFAASDERLAEIARTIQLERLCCRFLRFRLTVEPDEGPLALEVTGPPGTREFLRGMLDHDRADDPPAHAAHSKQGAL